MEEKFVWDVRSKYVILLNNLNCTIYRIYSRIKRVSQYWLRIDGFLLLNTPQIQRLSTYRRILATRRKYSNRAHTTRLDPGTAMLPPTHPTSFVLVAANIASNPTNNGVPEAGDNDTKISCFLYLITISNLRIGNRAIIAVESTLFVGPLESNEEMHANTNARGGRDNNARRGDK